MVPNSTLSVHFELKRNQEDKKANRNTYQKMLKPYSSHFTSTDANEEHLYEDVQIKKSPRGYTDLDQTKREDADALYQSLVKK